MSTSAGRVLPIAKGDYNNATTYSVLDWVLYNGKPYIAKQTTTGNLPTDTTYWQLLVDNPTTDFVGATSQAAGTHGLVPAPTSAERGKYLKGDGTWGEPQSGHVISDGTNTYTQRSNLVFNDFYIEDDPINNATKIWKTEPIDLVPWSSGTDVQIGKMIDAYYAGTITLEDVKSVWSVGDVRSVSISAIETTGTAHDNTWSVDESHRAQTVQVEILDFDHDTLTTPRRGITKALITVDLKGYLIDGTSTYGATNTENGKIDASNVNVSWKTCAIRSWCNGGFYSALPTYIRDRVKAVDKLTANAYQSSTIETTSDYIFLSSEVEVTGGNARSAGGEGTQYAYFAAAESNRGKLPGYGSYNPTTMNYWFRSPSNGANKYFVCLYGNVSNTNICQQNDKMAIAPAWCL